MSGPELSGLAGIFDRAAATYDQVGVSFFTPAGGDLVRAAAPRPGESVLDLGCGRGASLLPAAEAVGAGGRVVGVDIAPGMVERLRVEVGRRGLRTVDVLVGDAADPPLPAGSFDLVLAGFVLFFLPDAPAALSGWARLLRPGGRLATTTFTELTERETDTFARIGAALAPFLAAGPPVESSGPPPERRLRTAESVGALFGDSGFDVLRSAERRYDLDFTGVDQYWDWLWSAGMRGMLERIPAPDLPSARRALGVALKPDVRADGSLQWTIGVRFTVARRG